MGVRNGGLNTKHEARKRTQRQKEEEKNHVQVVKEVRVTRHEARKKKPKTERQSQKRKITYR